MSWTALSPLPTYTTPYVVSQRMKHAIESLDLDTAPPPRAVVGVVSHAPTLRAFLARCLERTFEVVAAPTAKALAETPTERPPSLLVADLHTLNHQRAADLDFLDGAYATLPLLIVSQESVSQARKLSASVLDRPHATLQLPAGPTDLRRAAAALLETPPSSPSP